MNQQCVKVDQAGFTPRRSATDIVIDGLKEQILNRTLRPGDRLPNELELCKVFDVSRGSLREAIKILSAMGILDLRPGVGTFVSVGDRDRIRDSLFFNLFLTYPDIEDIIPLRHIIEQDVLELIVDNYDKNEKERAAMCSCLDEMAKLIQAGQPCDALLENDLKFHQTMASACKNGVIALIYCSLLDYIRNSISESYSMQSSNRIYSSHQKIMTVIIHRQRDQIPEAVDFSLDPWKYIQN